MKQLRFFFDPGSGTCLWAANDDARVAYGYAVDHQALPLSDSVKVEITRLITAFDASIDWGDPTSPGATWTAAVEAAFLEAAHAARARVAAELRVADVTIIAERSLVPDRVDGAHPRRP